MYKKLIIAIVLIAIAALLVTQFSQYLTLDVAKAKQAELANYIDAHLLQAALIYFVVYVLLTAFSIPGATVVTLLGAALFGFWLSLLLASFASTLVPLSPFSVAASYCEIGCKLNSLINCRPSIKVLNEMARFIYSLCD